MVHVTNTLFSQLLFAVFIYICCAALVLYLLFYHLLDSYCVSTQLLIAQTTIPLRKYSFSSSLSYAVINKVDKQFLQGSPVCLIRRQACRPCHSVCSSRLRQALLAILEVYPKIDKICNILKVVCEKCDCFCVCEVDPICSLVVAGFQDGVIRLLMVQKVDGTDQCSY